MANIISPICFSNANNDSTNNGSDFKVRAREYSAWICVFSPFLKAQEIDMPLPSTSPACYRVGAPYVFPEDDPVKF